MTRLEAHAMFAEMEDRSFLIDGDALEAYFPSVCVALVEAVDRLEYAETEADLREAASYGELLVRNELLDTDTVTDGAESVIREVLKWCEELGEQLCSQDS